MIICNYWCWQAPPKEQLKDDGSVDPFCNVPSDAKAFRRASTQALLAQQQSMNDVRSKEVKMSQVMPAQVLVGPTASVDDPEVAEKQLRSQSSAKRQRTEGQADL